MTEFTLRNKKTTPIMTLTVSMFERMRKARPESVSLVLAKRIRDYKALTGKTLSLDYEQERCLLAQAGANERGVWTSKYAQLPLPLSQVKSIFADGFMLRTLGNMSDDLAAAEAFYGLLDMQLGQNELA